MPSLNQVKDSIGLEAVASPGVPVDPLYVVPISGAPGLDLEIGTEADNAIVGKGMAAGSYKVSEDSKDGSTALALRSVPAMALIMHSLLGGGTRAGQTLTGVEIGAIARVRYKGSKEACKLTIVAGATPSINAKTGVRGAETNEATFGTAGTLTLTAVTVEQFISTIDGYDDFEAEFVQGDLSIVSASKIINFGTDTTAQEGKGAWCYIYWAPATTSGLYRYDIPVVLTNTERPTLTRQIDNRGQSEGWSGFVVDSLSLEASLQAFVSATMQGLAMSSFRPKTLKGTTTNGSPTVSMVDTRELRAGMTISGTGIMGGTTISAITKVDEYGTLTLSQNATAAGRVDLTVDLPAKSALNLESAKPFVFNEGKTSVDGTIVKFIRQMSMEIKNNHPADTGYGQGSYARQLHQKGMFEVTGSIQLALDSSSLALRNKALDGVKIGLGFEFRGALIDAAKNLFEYMIVEAPYVQLGNFTRPDNNGQLDASAEFTVVNPAGTYYNSPFKVTLLIAKATI